MFSAAHTDSTAMWRPESARARARVLSPAAHDGRLNGTFDGTKPNTGVFITGIVPTRRGVPPL